MQIDYAFWKDKKILITGCTGFKGSWLTLWLSCLGAKCIGYGLDAPTNPNLFGIANISELLIGHEVRDINNLNSIQQAIDTYKPEIIIHLAAQPLVSKAFKEPVLTFKTNVMGTVNVLEAVRRSTSNCVKVVLCITSDKCYQELPMGEACTEESALGGFEPYASSKACSELVVQAYREAYFKETGDNGVKIASARAGNIIGGGDWGEQRLIPDIMNAFMDNKDPKIRNPDYVRPWQFVLEALNGYLQVIWQCWQNGQSFARAWNFGPYSDDIWSVAKVAKVLGELWGKELQLKSEENTAIFKESKWLNLDCSLAHRELGWYPVLQIPKALEWTTQWYNTYQDLQNTSSNNSNLSILNIMREQIQRYEKLVTEFRINKYE